MPAEPGSAAPRFVGGARDPLPLDDRERQRIARQLREAGVWGDLARQALESVQATRGSVHEAENRAVEALQARRRAESHAEQQTQRVAVLEAQVARLRADLQTQQRTAAQALAAAKAEGIRRCQGLQQRLLIAEGAREELQERCLAFERREGAALERLAEAERLVTSYLPQRAGAPPAYATNGAAPALPREASVTA